jgi:hypothetical protein
VDRLAAIAVDALQPGGTGEGEALGAQPVDDLVLVAEALGSDRGHPPRKVATAAGLEPRQELALLLLLA